MSISDERQHLQERFDAFLASSRSEPALNEATRRRLLKALGRMVRDNQRRFASAIDADFGHRPEKETELSEVVPTLQAVQDALSHLGRWMLPQRRKTAFYFWPSRSRALVQPKGVVGIISPWNYPSLLALGPAVGALAAGNRIIVKPSELTPRFSALLKKLLPQALGEDIVHVATGGVEITEAVTSLPLDHILFTGSTRVGALVMQAASKNLTPVTLELGGKSSVVIHSSYSLKDSARRIAHGKLLNAGQTCNAPGYVLVPK